MYLGCFFAHAAEAGHQAKDVRREVDNFRKDRSAKANYSALALLGILFIMGYAHSTGLDIRRRAEDDIRQFM